MGRIVDRRDGLALRPLVKPEHDDGEEHKTYADHLAQIESLAIQDERYEEWDAHGQLKNEPACRNFPVAKRRLKADERHGREQPA